MFVYLFVSILFTSRPQPSPWWLGGMTSLSLKNIWPRLRNVFSVPQHPVIKGKAVETVQEYKYLGTFLDEKLNFDANTDTVCKTFDQ